MQIRKCEAFFERLSSQKHSSWVGDQIKNNPCSLVHNLKYSLYSLFCKRCWTTDADKHFGIFAASFHKLREKRWRNLPLFTHPVLCWLWKNEFNLKPGKQKNISEILPLIRNLPPKMLLTETLVFPTITFCSAFLQWSSAQLQQAQYQISQTFSCSYQSSRSNPLQYCAFNYLTKSFSLKSFSCIFHLTKKNSWYQLRFYCSVIHLRNVGVAQYTSSET